MVNVIAIIDWTYRAIPPIGWVSHRVLEFEVEVIVKAHYEDMANSCRIHVKPDGKSGWISTLYLDLTLINHSHNNPQRIIGCCAELRSRRLLFWHRTLATFKVLSNSPTDYETKYPIEDIYLEPTNKPRKLVINIFGDFTLDNKMPKKSELVLVFSKVGAIRRYEKSLETVLHNPTSVTEDEE